MPTGERVLRIGEFSSSATCSAENQAPAGVFSWAAVKPPAYPYRFCNAEHEYWAKPRSARPQLNPRG